jgi:NADH dehydrogenase (ubiquinone) 1 beta subcomplex subunit 9
MNKAFREVAAQTRMKLPELTHKQRVTRLYRNALRVTFSWALDRRIFLEEAEALRAKFDALKNESADSGKVRFALTEGERKLADMVHPDPYCIPWMPGGSKFMRNPPPPPAVCGEHYPLTGTDTPVWPDMVPITFRPVGTIESLLVDFGKKNYE